MEPETEYQKDVSVGSNWVYWKGGRAERRQDPDQLDQLRRQLTTRRGIRALLREDQRPKPGEILDAIWTNPTVVGVLLVASLAALARLATLHS